MKCRIALCDGYARDREMVRSEAAAVLSAMGFACVFSIFDSGEALLAAMCTEKFDLVLLEIEMPGMDGIETGKRIRIRGSTVLLAYVSNREDRVFDVFQVQPIGFVRKNRMRRDMLQLAKQYQCAAFKSQDLQLELETRSGKVRMDTEKIRYVEGLGNYQLVHLAEEAAPLEIKMTMDRLEAVLESCGFLRIHRGYLVNPDYVVRITYDFAFLADGLRLPVGQSRARLVRQQYMRQQENRA